MLGWRKKKVEAVVTAMYETRQYSLHQLGQGKKNGGFKDHQENLFYVLDRVRGVSELSPGEASQWVPSKIAWDQKMAALYQQDWASVFIEKVKALLNDIRDGKQMPYLFSWRARRRVWSRICNLKGIS